MSFLKKFFGNYSKRELKRIQPICDAVLALEQKYQSMSEAELKNMTVLLKERLANGETLDDILPDAFAACREASWRVLGMKHFPVQIIGGIVLHQGRISEMKTGEGKTLVATLPAYLNALSGKGVHVVTVNDYLARRDSEWMGKVYRYLGLTVGLVTHAIEAPDKKEQYLADITYGTNNEFGFDYLRDNMVPYNNLKAQRGHNFAIVDEVDSILIDEARTPLIISGKGDKSTELYTQADKFAKTLHLVKVTETESKVDTDEMYKDADYIVDEKARTATLTANGVRKAEAFFNIENLTDSENITIQHHINQAIKARGTMQRDIDYVVKDGAVLIVDEFTGRILPGRRYNEGLHQAIEAKENVKVERESKTLATITFQNYFRLYDKLSGMTGTAMTEEEEFREIYKLDVIEIPTNKPMIRQDLDDAVYKNERGKFNAVIENIIECNQKGQPVLVGTISIERSEVLSALLKKRGVKHVVLNAKFHEQEAEIVAQAGKLGAVTIATNMAGRGTDIVLGGNAEYMAKAEMRRLQFPEEMIVEATGFSETDDEEINTARKTYAELHAKYKEEIQKEASAVRDAGGLFIIGTERHESRRIDNQLRGRSGRQGDPGASRFYISAEDDLMRLFAGERLKTMMDRLRIEEDVPIEAGLVSNTIESAQQKVEARNFGIRKHVLQFDDVMNVQRELIYKQRDTVLENGDVRDSVRKMIEDTIVAKVQEYLSDAIPDNWNLAGLRDYYLGWLTNEEDLRFTPEEMDMLDKDYVVRQLKDRAFMKYDELEKLVAPEILRDFERKVLLQNVDTYWMEHIDAMEELKKAINLQAYGQRDPVVEYKFQGSDMFDEMIASIRDDTARKLLSVKVVTQEEVQRKQVAQPTAASGGGDGTESQSKTVRKSKKPGRNDPCPCGSGKKYKKCCGAAEE